MQFSSTEFFFFKKKKEEFKKCEKDVLPNYNFASFLRREFPHLEKDQQTRNRVFVQKKKRETVTKGNMKKNIFLWRRESTKKDKFKKNTEFIVEIKRKNDSQKRMRLFKAKLLFFFFQNKLKRQKKTGDAKGDKKAQTTIATRRKDKEQEKCAPKRKRKTKQRERSEKWWKRTWKKRR